MGPGSALPGPNLHSSAGYSAWIKVPLMGTVMTRP
ncbi:hypothetical protein P3T35_006283 [Kitasatospora sp. GP30]|nr:hypothetical protein [Kitasatospora sp. GP30]